MADPTGKRLFQIKRLPSALLQAFMMLLISGVWHWFFAWFWTFMVIDLSKDLGPYSQMSSLSIFMHRAFPMRETNDTSFEYQFEHILILACVLATMLMAWEQTRYEVQQEKDKKAGQKGKKKTA
mmetsp:Transcript_52797/g.123497  ORF Transcript_52797/g.123497 Transcript_52797/m.123497 type:complete len:124 (-) Transcript_52797:101-472(-)